MSTQSCGDNQRFDIPDFPFSFTINLITDNDLVIPGNSKYYPGAGYGGVIVYCEIQETYYAFNAACTYEASNDCRLTNTGILGKCSCCKSEYTLHSNGYPAKGPAVAPLRQYQVTMGTSFTLRVYNWNG